MAETDDKFDLDFTAHFDNSAVEAEKLPLASEAAPGRQPPERANPATPAAAKPAAGKPVLDPEFKIGTSKLEADGYYVAVIRRNFSAAASGGRRILFVEDEPVTNAILKKVLTTDGFEAHGALDSAGLGALLKQHGLPDLFMLDVELPKVSGLQILSRIRKHPKLLAIPVLILTSRAEMSDVARGLSLGANGYLSKPVTVETLRGALRQILGELPQKS